MYINYTSVQQDIFHFLHSATGPPIIKQMHNQMGILILEICKKDNKCLYHMLWQLSTRNTVC